MSTKLSLCWWNGVGRQNILLNFISGQKVTSVLSKKFSKQNVKQLLGNNLDLKENPTNVRFNPAEWGFSTVCSHKHLTNLESAPAYIQSL